MLGGIRQETGKSGGEAEEVPRRLVHSFATECQVVPNDLFTTGL